MSHHRLEREARPGDGQKIHTHGEVVPLRREGRKVVAVCTSRNARRALQLRRHGFRYVGPCGPDGALEDGQGAHGAVGPASFEVLEEGSVADLEAEIAAGGHDGHLAELLRAERAGKDRKTAKAAIEERIEDLEE